MNNMETSHEQQKFWDAESEGDSGYPARFLDGAARQRWIEQIQQVQRLGLVFRGAILELGGGSQFVSRWLAGLPDVRVTCTDISDQRIIDFNRHYGVSLKNLVTEGNINAERLPYQDQSFDWIVGDAMLHHIENIRGGLYEMRRCLRPGGHAVFIREPVVGHLDFLKRRLKPHLQKNWQAKYRADLDASRYEYVKTYYQWKEEFYRAGWDARALPGWYTNNFPERFKTRFPSIFTSSVTWLLRPVPEAR